MSDIESSAEPTSSSASLNFSGIRQFNSLLNAGNLNEAARVGKILVFGTPSYPQTLRTWIQEELSKRGLALSAVDTQLPDRPIKKVVSDVPTYKSHPRAHLIDTGALEFIQVETHQDIYTSFREYPNSARAIKNIAFYLPQFHPFKENDEWWGKGFTEWTNVGKALPRYKGHYQPHCPIHLGYYDLRVVDNMIEQANLARNYGIDAFSYYFYWFAGKTLMEQPLLNMLAESEVSIPFCLTWANENWTRRWDGAEHDVLISQSHSIDDSISFFKHIIKYLLDPRYLLHENKPILIVYRADIIPHIQDITEVWRNLAEEFGFDGLYLIAAQTFGIEDPTSLGFDAAVEFPPHGVGSQEVTHQYEHLVEPNGPIYSYQEVVANKYQEPWTTSYKKHYTSMLSWDNTARKGASSHVFEYFSLGAYQSWHYLNLAKTIAQYHKHPDYPPITFINAWNEWAEGTHLEPDQKFGYSNLNATYHASQMVSGCKEDLKLIGNHNDPRITQKPSQTAVIIHCHYIDIYQEIVDKLEGALPLDSVDVYVTTNTLEKAVAIRSISPYATIDLIPNIGRDIRPFLHILSSISENGLCYQSCLKLHTKKTIYRPDGSELREKLLNSLLAKSTVDLALSRINWGSDVGLVCPKEALIDHYDPNGNRMKYNHDNIRYICGKIGISFSPSRFPAGSMFWFNQPCFFPLNALKNLAWSPEIGLVDGTFAHAVERIFVSLVEHQNKLVLPGESW